MPELPEVETIARDLRPLLTGRVIRAARRLTTVALRRPWLENWHDSVKDRTILDVRRRGKWLVLPLSGGLSLVVHLGMTGQLTYASEKTPIATHTHLIFDLDDGQVRFRDTRRFGCVSVFEDDESLQQFFVANGLGPEPFDLDATAWRRSLANTKRNLKATLLDQTIVAGVGNIYADEALFVARLHPARRACDLTRAEADRLRKAVVSVLSTAIECRGSTIRDYIGGSGLKGGYQDEFRVYSRTGEPCSRCKTPIAALRLAGRSSHFCPKCQPTGEDHSPKRKRG